MKQINKFEEEIDLIDLLKKLWKHNLKILASVSFSLLGTFIFLSLNPLKFTVSTPFSKINETEKLKYSFLNIALTAKNINLIDRNFLLNFYKDKLRENAIEVLDEYNIISKSSFKTNQEFDSNLDKVFMVKGPFEPRNELKKHFQIIIVTDKIAKGVEVIKEIDQRTNEKTRVEITQLLEKITYRLKEQYSEAERNLNDNLKQNSFNSNYLILNNYLALKEKNNLFLLKNALKDSPLMDVNSFRATKLNLKSTQYNNPYYLLYLIILLISFMSSSIYILKFIEISDKE